MGFGKFSGALLVGNFGAMGNNTAGRINAFGNRGEFLGELRRPNGQVISIPGLWGMKFGAFENADPEACEPVYVLNWMCTVASRAEPGAASESEFAAAFSSFACSWSWWWPHWTRTTVPAPAWPPVGPPSTGPGDWPWHDFSNPPTSTLGICGYQYTVTDTITRTRTRYWPGIGTAICVEQQ